MLNFFFGLRTFVIMKYAKKILSQTITQLCLAKEIKHIVISPGSRNAPLTIGFTENPSFHNYSIVDERCAAFFALGIAQQLRHPVALVCTSGSALLNYYPAIAEAFYSDIPLVVLSADRPAHLIDIGDGQTIRQENVFSNHILYNANCREGGEDQAYNEAEINKALNIAITQQGPVHINAPFSEPLYETVALPTITPKNVVPALSKGVLDDTDDFVSHWNSSQRKMILVGVLEPGSLEEAVVDFLANDESVMVLTETTSNLHHENFFPAIDQLIAPLEKQDFERLQPDVLLTFGGMVVSKKIKAFLRSYAPKKHYHVNSKRSMDTYFCLSRYFKCDIDNFLKSIISDLQRVKSDYRKYWTNVRNHRLERHAAYENLIPFSDFSAFTKVFSSLPKACHLQLANSATVRYAQLYDLHRSIKVHCNRGTSGIDGSSSTAIGASLTVEEPTVLVTGDLSFLYDSNALWNHYIPKHFRIIIVNNSGGGIFRILPGKKDSKNFATYFETKHGLTAEQLAKMYHFEYESVSSEADLDTVLSTFYAPSERPKLLEIFTPSEINDVVLLDYFKFIK